MAARVRYPEVWFTELKYLPRIHYLGISALTPDRTECQTVVRREKCSMGGFSFVVRSPYNKRTMDAGLWGIWLLVRMQNQKVTCYQCDDIVQIPASAPDSSYKDLEATYADRTIFARVSI